MALSAGAAETRAQFGFKKTGQLHSLRNTGLAGFDPCARVLLQHELAAAALAYEPAYGTGQASLRSESAYTCSH